MNGSEFMRKQELIDATEASGLSRAPIAYDIYLLSCSSLDFFLDILVNDYH